MRPFLVALAVALVAAASARSRSPTSIRRSRSSPRRRAPIRSSCGSGRAARRSRPSRAHRVRLAADGRRRGSARQLGRRDQHGAPERRARLGAAEAAQPAPRRVVDQISLSSRTLVLSRNGDVVRRVPVGIGAASSPTPVGRYVVTDHIDPARLRHLGLRLLHPRALGPPAAPAGRVEPEPRLAPRDPRRRPGAISAGCVHADDATLRLLMRMTPLGTPSPSRLSARSGCRRRSRRGRPGTAPTPCASRRSRGRTGSASHPLRARGTARCPPGRGRARCG